MQFKVVGEPMPVAIVSLSQGETIVTESGAMSWMSDNIQMETKGGGVGKMLGRAFSGESLFLNRYTAQGPNQEIALASCLPGCIRPYEITPNKSIIVQKGGFLAAEATVELSIHYKKKLGASLFGGEGIIMQKISGNGTALIEIDGYAIDYDLIAGQKLIVDTGYVVVMDETCTMDVVTVPGVKNMLFGGEGIFNTVITGPGRVTVQTMPVSSLAGTIIPFLPRPTK
ncbi:TIGR00266 family protein [Tannockella kyphosi]|uniref:TIGR00266 family protein n=1 Tax=Tannockella kyphosi TaxID=2899121 RepID=UPI0020113320|nr:TIGR00266 family protein [Tannockella kyphosi]